MSTQKICIIGDGLTGLSAAAILSQDNVKIDLYVGDKNFNKSIHDTRTTAVSESSYQFIKQKLNINKKSLFWPCEEINLFIENNKDFNNFLNFKKKKSYVYFSK